MMINPLPQQPSRLKRILVVIAVLVFASFAGVRSLAHGHHHDDSPPSGQGLSNTVILIVSHAEKPDDGPELAPAGVARSHAYVRYFENYTLNGQPLHFDYLYAAKDTAGSERPRLTLEPLSQALNMPLDTDYKDKDPEDLVADLQSKAAGKNVLICWHHGEIPDLLAALGADPDQLIPGGKWPEDQYGWVIQLCYDKDGHLIPGESRRVVENLVVR